jgi:DNA-binding transcriptional MerR regulator
LAERPYMSIGDVLSLLREEFPDVTISKIRFLESQGLLDPERTPSGYRKFYPDDVERLRWILRQQRENFLPLKVIRDRLEEEGERPAEPEQGNGPPAMAGARAVTGHTEAGGTEAGEEGGTETAGARSAAAGPQPGAQGGQQGGPLPPSGGNRQPGRREPGVPGGESGGSAPAQPARSSGLPLERSGSDGRHLGRREPLAGGPTSVSLTAEELAGASGLSPDAVEELERYGLIAGRSVAGAVYYDHEALTVARLAVGFSRLGIEPRHLRMYKTTADREAGFYEQVVLPLLRQRNPAARQRANETLAELTRLGHDLRASLLRTALKDQIGM